MTQDGIVVRCGEYVIPFYVGCQHGQCYIGNMKCIIWSPYRDIVQQLYRASYVLRISMRGAKSDYSLNIQSCRVRIDLVRIEARTAFFCFLVSFPDMTLGCRPVVVGQLGD